MYRKGSREVEVLREVRENNMKFLVSASASVGREWHKLVAGSSLVLTSKDKTKIIKVDSSKVYTMDTKQTDGSYKSAKFSCTSIEEAWAMASQAVVAYSRLMELRHA